MKVMQWFKGLSKKTKVISAVVVGVIVLGMGVGFGMVLSNGTAGEDNGFFHSHTWDEGEIIQAATCNRAGEILYECQTCGTKKEESLKKNSYDANAVYEMTKDSIGEITTYDKKGNEIALGTGFVYSKDGKIITNYHVIEDAYSIKITIQEKTYTVQHILAYNKNKDIAILGISATNLKRVSLCKLTHDVGTAVYAIGSSKGLTDTFSRGIITYADREIDGVSYVQHDAAISSGNSGGPLINEYGEVIGINTMTMKDSQNLNFAISVNELDDLKYETKLTVAQFYEKECDVFMRIKNYAMQYGKYDYTGNDYTVTLGYDYSTDYSSKYTRKLVYDVADEEIILYLWIDSDYLLGVFIDEIDSIYTWIMMDTDNDYYMGGNLYASTYTQYSTLSYTMTNIYYSFTKTSFRELSESMLDLLLLYFDEDFEDIHVTLDDIGFTRF